MDSARAIGVEVADELLVVGKPCALAAGDVIAPIFQVATEEIRVAHLGVPLVNPGEWR